MNLKKLAKTALMGLFAASTMTACKDGGLIQPKQPSNPPSNPGWRVGAPEEAPQDTTAAKDIPTLKL